jgi:hypothetical protein
MTENKMLKRRMYIALSIINCSDVKDCRDLFEIRDEMIEIWFKFFLEKPKLNYIELSKSPLFEQFVLHCESQTEDGLNIILMNEDINILSQYKEYFRNII